ncbi:MAG: YceI family protein [Verrucomicrobiota bacterium]|nr:YceI family protein [Verrucomicrobiota bacterium]
MKPIFRSPRLILATVAALFATVVIAETSLRYVATPGSKMKIEGTSTIHDWTVEGSIIAGYVEVDSSFPLDPSKETPADLKLTPKVEVSIPVRSLKSGKSTMDSVMHGAMKQEEHPKIEYRLLEMKPRARTAGAPFVFDTTGTLKVAGVTRTNNMEVTMTPMAANKIKWVGSSAIKMTDFGIQPPAPKIALGAIKTGDEVKVSFEWVTAQKAAPATATTN